MAWLIAAALLLGLAGAALAERRRARRQPGRA
jgi:hypothetical protein